MKRRFKNSIVFKIFAVTSILLLVSTALVYTTIYFFLPSYYANYKMQKIDSDLNKMVLQINNKDQESIKQVLVSYEHKNDMFICITDKNNRVTPNLFSLNSALMSNVVRPLFSYFYNSSNYITNSQIVGTMYIGDSDVEHKYNHVVSKKFNIKGDNSMCFLHAYVTLQPVKEVSLMMFRLLPFILAAITVISLLGALIYARLISRPLLSINKAAREMAEMNLDSRCNIKGTDELGELGHSLNLMAEKLQITMKNLKNSNLQLELDIKREQESEHRRREFMATVSHELKTPLTIIKGQLEGMIRNIGIYKDRDKYLCRSYEVAEEMDSLVKEILSISRLEATSFKLDRQHMSLSEAVDTCLANHREIAEERRLTVIENIEKNLIISADRKLIKKAVSNIISNAVNHSPEDETVTVSLLEKEGKAILEVENSGAHIDENDIERVFEAFYTADKSRSRITGGTASGTGLGLYIVKTIFDMHGFGCRIENTGSGVKFTAEFAIAAQTT